MTELVHIPDIGTDEAVEVIEINVEVGDQLELEQTLLVLESDKASMEIPSPVVGKVVKILVEVGAEVTTGQQILEVEAASDSSEKEEASAPKEEEPETAKEEPAAAPKEEAPAAEKVPPAEKEPTAEKAAAASGAATAVNIPDIGTDEEVEVIEINVAVGDKIEAEQTLIVLESDKASMEIPAPSAGVVSAIHLTVGQQVATGALILDLEAEGAAPAAKEESAAAPKEQPAAAKEASKVEESPAPKEPSAAKEEPAASGGVIAVNIPDIGTDDEVEVIEINVAVGDMIEAEQTLIALESDKASMEIPSPSAGEVVAIHVSVGQNVSSGTLILDLKAAGSSAAAKAEEPAAKAEEPKAEQPKAAEEKPASTMQPAAEKTPAKKAAPKSSGIIENRPSQKVHAGPAVRLLARELGVDLAQLQGTGPKDRILKEDVHQYVKGIVKQQSEPKASGSAIPEVPEIDFTKFGEISIEPASKLHKLTATNMHRSWLNVPHVTQFDELDITELESFRKDQKPEAEKRGVKLTPLAFIFKALALTLKESPKINASLSNDGQSIIYKKYVHIGMAVDTPQGLVVPVIRDVDKKSIWELAEEIAEIAGKARDRKLRPNDMQGGCFTVSSLGGIGGTGFTPIVNAPEVAILGISKLDIKPVWNPESETFEPHKMLPVSLSYDHRAINGADAGRFLFRFNQLVADLRQLALIG